MTNLGNLENLRTDKILIHEYSHFQFQSEIQNLKFSVEASKRHQNQRFLVILLILLFFGGGPFNDLFFKINGVLYISQKIHSQ